jgi:NADPH-dependent 2,4-dienoyl-CoA reductase/sulfur reductase-like enzyme
MFRPDGGDPERNRTLMRGRGDDVEIAVLGAGPAGLAAAATAASHGATVALVDAGDRPGGQYWRQPADTLSAFSSPSLYHRLAHYRDLVARLRDYEERGVVTRLDRHDVWALGRHGREGFAVHAVDRSEQHERERSLVARQLVLATGAYDRQIPFPGWTLPGVMTAGGLQALLKGQAIRLEGRRVVVAGTGPFLLPVAAGLAATGARVVGVHEANSPSRWLRHAGAVLQSPSKISEALGYASRLTRRRVPFTTRSVVTEAHGDGTLRSVTTARVDARGASLPLSQRTTEADLLAVGWGFTPQLELPLALGCATHVDGDSSVVVTVDDDQQTSVPGAFAAGEVCGVGGAELAVLDGTIAGAAAAGDEPASHALRRRRRSLRRFAAAMHRAHPVPEAWIARLEPDTVVCRCEEVTAGELREVADRFAAHDPRTAKLLSRAGMGWCQARVCGYATACLSAAWSGGSYSPELVAQRPVATPVTLGFLAQGERE